MHSQPIVTRHALRAQRARGRDWILLAEDNIVNQKVATRLLEKLDYRVDVVGDGRAAVTAWQKGAYDLILMDCQMPELDGYEATREIRRLENGAAHIPIVALTAHAMKGAELECLAAGMDDYLSKPIDKNKLEECLERHIKLPLESVDTSSTTSSEGAVSAQAATSEPIDWAALLVSIDGDLGTAREFAVLFADMGRNTLQEMMDALDRGDISGVANCAHEFKGACANLKASLAAKAAEQLETAARNNDGRELRELADDLRRELQSAIQFLAAKVS
jgi:CheY-like chemotaxis protein